MRALISDRPQFAIDPKQTNINIVNDQLHTRAFIRPWQISNTNPVRHLQNQFLLAAVGSTESFVTSSTLVAELVRVQTLK